GRLEVCRGDESSDADRLDLRRDTLRLQRGLAVWLIKAAAGVSWRRDCNVTDAKKTPESLRLSGVFDFLAGTSDAKSAGIRRKGRGMNPFLLCIQQNAEPCKFFSVQRKFFR